MYREETRERGAKATAMLQTAGNTSISYVPVIMNSSKLRGEEISEIQIGNESFLGISTVILMANPIQMHK